MEQYDFCTINGFHFFIKHSVCKRTDDIIQLDDHHIHDTCEIYVNLSGDVSFMVENNIYPVKRGEAIITRPYEHHHCIYHSSAEHEHYWILFSPSGNEPLLKSFFERKAGEGNHIIPHDNGGEMLIELCENLLLNTDDQTARIIDFWRLIKLLADGTASKAKDARNMHHIKLWKTLDFIQERLLDEITVSDLANHANVSVNTLERWFKEAFGISPKEFILQKRLNIAALSLRNNCNVQEAGFNSGFNDISYFIKKFKHYYGITPHKYSKAFTTGNSNKDIERTRR